MVWLCRFAIFMNCGGERCVLNLYISQASTILNFGPCFTVTAAGFRGLGIVYSFIRRCLFRFFREVGLCCFSLRRGFLGVLDRFPVPPQFNIRSIKSSSISQPSKSSCIISSRVRSIKFRFPSRGGGGVGGWSSSLEDIGKANRNGCLDVLLILVLATPLRSCS